MTLDVLIPTYRRDTALAVTMTSLALQDCEPFRVVVSDQNEDRHVAEIAEMRAVERALRLHGREVVFRKHLPRRGMAEQRDFLLRESTAEYALYLDDDLILETDLLRRMLRAIEAQGCGFVGCPVIGLSYVDDEREQEQPIEFWEGRVEREDVRPGSAAWERYRLHNAANPLHVQRRLQLTTNEDRLYRVAWVGGCVLYDVEKLRAVGGLGFWRDLPSEHAGEDVVAQLRVMSRYGGSGLMPSGAYHQELPTTIPDRRVDAPLVLL